MKVWTLWRVDRANPVIRGGPEIPLGEKTEVVEKAEYDKLRAALEKIHDHEVVSYVSVLNAFKIYRNGIQEMAKEALDEHP